MQGGHPFHPFVINKCYDDDDDGRKGHIPIGIDVNRTISWDIIAWRQSQKHWNTQLFCQFNRHVYQKVMNSRESLMPPNLIKTREIPSYLSLGKKRPTKIFLPGGSSFECSQLN
jgi:hypothetical protein